MFHGGVYKKESMQPYFNTVRMAIKLSKISQDWEVAKTYFEKKHKMTATETLKRLYDSVLNV